MVLQTVKESDVDALRLFRLSYPLTGSDDDTICKFDLTIDDLDDALVAGM